MSLTLFTTGVHTHSFGRPLTPIGCLVGHETYVSAFETPERVQCRVKRSALVPGTKLSALLRHDDRLKRALSVGTEIIRGETFTLEETHISPVHNVSAEVREKCGGDNVVAIHTSVHWHSGLLDASTGYRYELCVMTAMKQYPLLLPGWISYLINIGVDHVYIYENAAPEPLRRYVDEQYVEVVSWPWARSQMQSNNHFLLSSRTRCKYAAFLDADEYPMVPDGQMKQYIVSRMKRVDQVIFPFVMMTNNGYVRRPAGALPELYTRRERDQVLKLGKPVIDTKSNWEEHRIHVVKGPSTRTYWNGTMDLDPRSLDHNCMLVHFTHRSWEDFMEKSRIGGASVMTKGRPVRVLSIESPDEKYMDLRNGVQWLAFRDKWRTIMKRRRRGHSVILREGVKMTPR